MDAGRFHLDGLHEVYYNPLNTRKTWIATFRTKELAEEFVASRLDSAFWEVIPV